MRTLPFYGQGTAFPFRINDSTGGVVVTVGVDDSVSVALQYLNERWTIREETDAQTNHIAESIAHILLTRPTEHDTLPPFGSDLFTIIFEPNTEQFRVAAAHYFQHSTERWEHRARIVETDWYFEGRLVDQGILPVIARVRFITEQTPENLVAPFVTTRQARDAEYPVGSVDLGQHDYPSRYYGQDLYHREGLEYIRLQAPRFIEPAPDDQYYKVKVKDSWLLISWELYHDIRYWPIIAQTYAYDQAAKGLDRSYMDTTGDPPANERIRVPSYSRILSVSATL